jgi:hypothetical protein
MRRSPLFRDPNNPKRAGKGSWRRKANEKKVGETLDRVFGEKDPVELQKHAGKTVTRYRI